MSQSAAPKKNRKKGRKKMKLTAKTADKFALYERSVQEPEADVKFLNRIFKKEHGRKPMSLREDFCGTAYLCSEWVKSHSERTAVGVDLDQPTLDWGIAHHLDGIGSAAERVQLLCQNVMDVHEPRVDVAVAFNFSYCILRERQDLKRYFQVIRDSLTPGGAFVVDMHGGPEAHEELEEETEFDNFTYVWDQGSIDAVTNVTHRAIHFTFPDGSSIKNAFRYHWRVWSMTEIRDLMEECGYSRVDVYWEGYDKDGEGNGVFRKVQKADNDESWIAYIVAWA